MRSIYEVSAIRPINYSILQTTDLFSVSNSSLLLHRTKKGGNCAVVIDEIVLEQYRDQIFSFFEHHKIKLTIIPFRAKEQNKSLAHYQNLNARLEEAEINRRSEPVIIIGGGVTLDVGAFAASTFRRGLPHIKIPTTLMAYIDASLGIKNGIDFLNQKNRIGSFSPPLAVILDKQFLHTLPARHLSNGFGEIIKVATSSNEALFNLLEQSGKQALDGYFRDSGDEILESSIVSLMDELSTNLYEDNLARKADFGHTFSPVIEMNNLQNGMLHGEAVAIDIAITCAISYSRGILAKQDLTRVLALIKSLNLNLLCQNITVDLLFSGLNERVLHRDGFQNVPSPCKIGDCVFLQDISKVDIEKALTVITEYES